MHQGPEPAVEVRGVAFRYGGPGARAVLRDVDLEVPRGARLALLGPSGSGKSTLLRLVAGLLRPGAGRVTLRLPEPAPAPEHLRAGRVGYIPQHLGLVRSRTVLDNVLAGALARTHVAASLVGDFGAADLDAADEALASVGLAGRGRERVHSLSGGERQRVAIARALVQRPALLCADEFVSNLDEANADRMLALVDALRDRGVTVVMVMHDLALARRHADELAFVRGGGIARRGRAEDVSLEEARWQLEA